MNEIVSVTLRIIFCQIFKITDIRIYTFSRDRHHGEKYLKISIFYLSFDDNLKYEKQLYCPRDFIARPGGAINQFDLELKVTSSKHFRSHSQIQMPYFESTSQDTQEIL